MANDCYLPACCHRSRWQALLCLIAEFDHCTIEQARQEFWSLFGALAIVLGLVLITFL